MDDLAINTDCFTLRRQLGQHIGIDENQTQDIPGQDSALQANLGHATLFCLQSQSEIANREVLFHRQDNPFVSNAIKATLPYFLGAVPHDQLRKRAQLERARDHLKEADEEYRRARSANQTAGTTLASLWHEAHAIGIVPLDPPSDFEAIVETLLDAATAPTAPMTEGVHEERRVLELQAACESLREQLRAVATDRRLLLAQDAAAADAADAVRVPRDRLASLSLLTPLEDGASAVEDSAVCVLCGSALPVPDPTVAALRHSLRRLAEQLDGIHSKGPARQEALEDIDRRADRLREELIAAEQALQSLTIGQELSGHIAQGARADFTRGRIHGMLAVLRSSSAAELARLREARENAEHRVRALEGELDPAAEREQLIARLVSVGRDITMWANELGLEPRGSIAHLDISRLTVAFDTEAGQVPLSRLGSGENWVGYHVLIHLALHHYFVRNHRPLPRILFLDQLTQVWSINSNEVAGPEGAGADLESCRRLLRLIYEFVHELAPNFQVIVSDHVNLPESWFQESVVHSWRHGEKLVPREWPSRS
jgi:hypothetical protein